MTTMELIHNFDIKLNGENDIIVNAPTTSAEMSLIELAKPQILEILNPSNSRRISRAMTQAASMYRSTDRMLASIAWKAYDGFCRGEDPLTVTEQYEKEMAAYFSIAPWEN